MVNTLREDCGEGQISTEKLNRKEARGTEVSNHFQSEENEDKTGDKVFVDTVWKWKARTLISRHNLIWSQQK